jgi:hypothetical protein
MHHPLSYNLPHWPRTARKSQAPPAPMQAKKNINKKTLVKARRLADRLRHIVLDPSVDLLKREKPYCAELFEAVDWAAVGNIPTTQTLWGSTKQRVQSTRSLSFFLSIVSLKEQGECNPLHFHLHDRIVGLACICARASDTCRVRQIKKHNGRVWMDMG